MHQQVYHSRDIQAWEQRWFAQKNSSYGLMQQAAWLITQQIVDVLKIKNIHNIAVCCGQGNNAGDGYLIAKYLKQLGFDVEIYKTELGSSKDLQLAYEEAQDEKINIIQGFNFLKQYDCIIDALFGIGLNRDLDKHWQGIIKSINAHNALKIAIDIPSGLNANTGRVMPCAIVADYTYTVLAPKIGLYTGQAKEYTGDIYTIPLIPKDEQLLSSATLSATNVNLPKRKAYAHKGNNGHVLVVGGHFEMGGAVIMAAEAAFASGAGKVTVVCHENHHVAVLARSPNIMLRDINQLNGEKIFELIEQVDAVCFGMGLGRDQWSKQIYEQWFEKLQKSKLEVVLDADALWFLAENPEKVNERTYLTPHPGEAAKLLNLSTLEIETDRVRAIQKLKEKYQGQWVLKGSGSLVLDDQLWICNVGNAGMATGGMGDILSGMIASLKAQYKQELRLDQIVTLHARAGDLLAENGVHGIQAQHMVNAIYQVINNKEHTND